MRPSALLCAALLAGCTSSGGASDKELEGLVVAPPEAPETVDLAKASRDPAALTAAVRLPWSRGAAQLGEHRLTVRTTTELREGTTVLETLSDTTVIERAVDGRYHAVYENSADYGREVVFDGGKLFLRPRYARWHERAPETDTEAQAIADELAGALAAHLELYAHGVELSDKGPVQEAGRAGKRLELKLAPSPKTPPRAKVTQRGWRDDARVERASGELVLDDTTALPLRARLDATVAFVRDGKPLTMRLTLEQNLTLGPVAITRPEADQTVATPERKREVDDRNFLLQGIAPSAGKGAIKQGTAAPPADTAAPADKGATKP